jgi:4-aminobutyrate aminotransferase-like enzyme
VAKPSGRLARADAKLLVRDDDATPLELVASEGSFVRDARGRSYLDFFMGWCVGNLGWRQGDVVRAIRTFDGPTYVGPQFLYRPWVELAELLVSIAPRGLTRVHRTTTGSESVELAVLTAMAHTGRHRFVSVEGCYHGNSLGVRCVASSEVRDEHGRQLPTSWQVAPPLDEAAAGKVETQLAKRDVAAVVMEPVVCNLGVLVPERAFMQRVARACRRHGTLLVIDEVATGFGRTGRMFGAGLHALEPDMVCLAKALSGGYAPIGATLMTEKVARSVRKLQYYATWAWHPLAVDAALANMRYLVAHEQRILANVLTQGEHLRDRLARLRYPRGVRARVRGVGLAVGVDLGSARRAEQVEARCREQGLLVATEGASIVMFPALEITRALIDEGVDRFARALAG